MSTTFFAQFESDGISLQVRESQKRKERRRQLKIEAEMDRQEAEDHRAGRLSAAEREHREILKRMGRLSEDAK